METPARRGRRWTTVKSIANRDRGSGHPLAPPTPPYKRVRIRRFSELGPRGAGGSSRSPQGLRRSAGSGFGFHRLLTLQNSAEADWLAQCHPRVRRSTARSHCLGLPHWHECRLFWLEVRRSRQKWSALVSSCHTSNFSTANTLNILLSLPDGMDVVDARLSRPYFDFHSISGVF